MSGAESGAAIGITGAMAAMRDGVTVFRLLPGLALGAAVVGFAIREALIRRDLAIGKASPSGAWSRIGGGKLGKFGWIVLIGAHLAAFLFPRAILGWNARPPRLYALEAVGFAFGLLAVGGWAGALVRDFSKPRAASRLGQLVDSGFLSLLAVALASGLITAAKHRWASSWSTATVTPYLRSLAGQPAPELMAQMPFSIQLHVIAALLSIALLPFSSLGLALLGTVHWAAGVVVAPVAAIGDTAERWLGARSPASWLWPEEEPLVALSPAQSLGAHHGAGGGGPSPQREAAPLTPKGTGAGADDLSIPATDAR